MRGVNRMQRSLEGERMFFERPGKSLEMMLVAQIFGWSQFKLSFFFFDTRKAKDYSDPMFWKI